MRFESAAIAVAVVALSTAVFAQTSGPGPSAPGQAEPPRGDAEPGPGGYLRFYGHIDVSIDAATKGLTDRVQVNGDTPVGNMGWQGAIAANSSYVGVRGGHQLGTAWLVGLFQIEAQVDVSATPGYAMTNFSQDSRVAGALASRNSFLGLSGPWGSIKIGKHDTP